MTEVRTIGYASLVQRRLLHGGQALNTGYVEGVGVHWRDGDLMVAQPF
ncbi:MAG: hypothetical protein ACRDSR_02680 [Pseudonocardiaceae bacterium]